MLRPTRRACLALLPALAACAGPGGRRRAPAARLALHYDAQGSLFLEASVERQPPVRFLLDTGAARSTIATAYAERLGLELRPGAEIEGSAGVVRSASARAELTVPGMDPLPIDFAVYPFGSYDPECVGILGYEWLHRAPFQIRYRDRLLLWNAAAAAEWLPLTIEANIPRLHAEVNGVALALRLDTGAAFPPGDDYYLNLSADQALRLDLSGPPEKVFTATGTGDQVLELPVHRLEDFRLGSHRVAGAYAIVQPRVGYFARADAVGFLGNSVLDKLDPSFDYAGGRFGLSPAAR